MTTSFLFSVSMTGLGRRPSCLIFTYIPMNPVALHPAVRTGCAVKKRR
jgi:hypothetical protein